MMKPTPYCYRNPIEFIIKGLQVKGTSVLSRSDNPLKSLVLPTQTQKRTHLCISSQRNMQTTQQILGRQISRMRKSVTTTTAMEKPISFGPIIADIKQATKFDIPEIQACDLLCFPEEDPWPCDYCLYEEYIDFWPRLVYVAEDHGTGCVVGFVYAEIEGEGTETHGYVANVGVLPSHRKQGIAEKLMNAVHNALVHEYECEYVSLHVRTRNHAAINLYTEKLGYNYESVVSNYDNGEDAYVMRKQLQGKQTDHL